MITVRHSANRIDIDAAGRTIREIRDMVSDELSLPDGAEARVQAGIGFPESPVLADHVVQDGQIVTFIKAQGEKGGDVLVASFNPVELSLAA